MTDISVEKLDYQNWVSNNFRSRALGLINSAGDLGATLSPFSALGVLNMELIPLSGICKIAGEFFGVVALFTLFPFATRLSRTTINL